MTKAKTPAELMEAYKEGYENAGSNSIALNCAHRYMNAAEELKTQMQELCTLLDSRDKREKELREQRDQLLALCSAARSFVQRTNPTHPLIDEMFAAITRAEKGGV